MSGLPVRPRTSVDGFGVRELKALLDVPFSDEQIAAITAPLSPYVVVAGAGSGKTTVMTARVVWLVATGQVRADQVLGLTFTNKAASELGSRVGDAVRELSQQQSGDLPAGDEVDLGEPVIATYHSFAGRLLSEHGLRIGVEPRRAAARRGGVVPAGPPRRGAHATRPRTPRQGRRRGGRRPARARRRARRALRRARGAAGMGRAVHR